LWVVWDQSISLLPEQAYFVVMSAFGSVLKLQHIIFCFANIIVVHPILNNFGSDDTFATQLIMRLSFVVCHDMCISIVSELIH
jgi:hypothetical protein